MEETINKIIELNKDIFGDINNVEKVNVVKKISAPKKKAKEESK